MDSKEAIKKIFERKMTDAKDIIDEMLNAKLAENLGSLYEKLDPVGQEDGDIDNDGDEDDTDSYLLNRRKKIGQAMKKEDMQYEEEEKEEEKENKLYSRDYDMKKMDGLGKKKKTNESLQLDEVDLTHQSAHDHKETEAIEKSVKKTKVNAKGGTYNGS